MKKRKIAIILAGLLVLSMSDVIVPNNSLNMTITAKAEESDTIQQGDYVYKLNEDGTAKITSYKGEEKEIVTPSQVTSGDKVYKVTEIGYYAFSENDMKSVSISDGIENIGKGAFCRCRRLSNVTMSDSVETIEESAFDCAGIKNIKLS